MSELFGAKLSFHSFHRREIFAETVAAVAAGGGSQLALDLTAGIDPFVIFEFSHDSFPGGRGDGVI